MAKRRPHIAIVIANLPAERDRRVIREALSLEERGYGVTIIAPRGERGLRILPGSVGVRLRPYPLVLLGSNVVTFAIEFVWSFLCVAVRLTGEVLRGRAQAVQVCNPPDIYWPLALVMRLLGRPWVFDHHDLCPEILATRSGRGSGGLPFRILVAFEWLTLRTASAVIATNESFRENAHGRGVPPEKITVVRNGPAHSEIAGTGTASDWDEPVHHIVYLGVLGPQDNVEGAVLAAEVLRARRAKPDWRLLIAGDGESMPALRALVEQRDLADVVAFTGWLDSAEVDTFLQHATIGVQPDLPTRMNHLSTMAKTVEYLARGIPVVAVDLIETRRTAADAAVYVPGGTPEEFAEALGELLDDEPRRSAMSEVGLRRFADVLSWEHQANAYLGVWQRVLGRRAITAVPRVPASRAHEPVPETLHQR
jgi:glycosyltransferase involved in cell wall biosynthesis